MFQIVLYFFMGLYFGSSICTLLYVLRSEGTSYLWREAFGSLMILLFGPIVVAIFLLNPDLRERTRQIHIADRLASKQPVTDATFKGDQS